MSALTVITRDRLPELRANVGDRVIASVLTGYKLVQERPFTCRGWHPDPRNPGAYTGDCVCGQCDGVTTFHPGTVTHRTYWADNSIEITIAGDDGQTRRHMQKAPSGDACY
jgi:hypothetical protein